MSKYKSLEHVIQDMMLKESVGIGGTDKFTGMPNFPAYRGKGVEQGAARNRQLQAKAQPYGDFEGGKKKSLVPDQGDAQTSADLSARGAAQEGGKNLKRVKEDTDTNIDLIKKGSMLNKGPLTKYTNPQDSGSQSTATEPKPQLSFQTPDLSGKNGKDEDEIQTPKLKGKGDGKADARAKSQPVATAKNVSKPTSDTVTKTPENDSKLAKAEKTTNKIIKDLKMKGVGAGSSISVSVPELGLPSIPKPPNALVPSILGAIGGVGLAKGIDTVKRSDAWNRNSDANVKSSPGSMDPGASNFARQTLEKYTNPLSDIDPSKFNNQKQATPPVSPGGGMAGNTPKGTKSPSLENPLSPSKGSAPVDVIGKPLGDTSGAKSSGEAVGVPSAVDHANLPRSRAQKIVPAMRNPPGTESVPLPGLRPAPSVAIPKSDDSAHPAPALPVPHQGVQLPAVIPSTKPGSVPQQGADIKASTVPQQGKETQAERDEYNKQRDQQDKNSRKFPWLGWAGLGLGGLALLKYLAGSGRLGGDGGGADKKGGKFIYGTQGRISGTPTRQKGGQSNVKEEVEGTKIRRAVELVGRRTGDNKKKSALARQGAIKTRVIDESRLRIMREAIKEKQDKEKKLKPGEHKTPVDTHPTLSPEPTTQLTK